MTKQEKIKYAQNCICETWLFPEDSFTRSENVIFETDKTFFEIITFGGNAIMRVDEKISNWCTEKFFNTPANEILDGENLFLIEGKLREHGKKLGGEHLRFLHLNDEICVSKPGDFSFELYEKDQISELYSDKRFNNALNYYNDVLAIVARINGEIAAMAAADDNTCGLWQIGIDTLDEYRGKGLAAYLVKEIVCEIEKRGKVPFYTTWSANIASMRVAMAAGFCPVWINYFAENL